MSGQNGALILVVSESETERAAGVGVLDRAGFRVLEAATGQAALARVGAEHPAIVLLDVSLSDISGLEVCRRIKEDAASASSLVIHVAASFAQYGETVRSLEACADAYLTTPLDPTVLVATINALLRVRRAEDRRDEFLAVLSHELRTPLTAILGWVRTLRLRQPEAKALAHGLEVIERNTRMQAQLIDDLLDVSRIIAGKLSLERTPLLVAPVLEEALESVRAAADAQGVSLGLTVEDPGLRVDGDGGRLRQVFTNLLSNGVKFTPAHGRVDARLRRQRDEVVVTVSDTGRGIPPEFLPYVFDRFRQADGGITRAKGGLGLGLSIARDLVELHGGTVAVESAGEDQGAVFSVTLPAVADI